MESIIGKSARILGIFNRENSAQSVRSLLTQLHRQHLRWSAPPTTFKWAEGHCLVGIKSVELQNIILKLTIMQISPALNGHPWKKRRSIESRSCERGLTSGVSVLKIGLGTGEAGRQYLLSFFIKNHILFRFAAGIQNLLVVKYDLLTLRTFVRFRACRPERKGLYDYLRDPLLRSGNHGGA